jgi:hypothetical protein
MAPEEDYANTGILDEEKLNVRVYGKSGDIYVEGYKIKGSLN